MLFKVTVVNRKKKLCNIIICLKKNKNVNTKKFDKKKIKTVTFFLKCSIIRHVKNNYTYVCIL